MNMHVQYIYIFSYIGGDVSHLMNSTQSEAESYTQTPKQALNPA